MYEWGSIAIRNHIMTLVRKKQIAKYALYDLNKLQCNYKKSNYKKTSKIMGFVKIPFGYKNG
jgi:hypothetical protein